MQQCPRRRRWQAAGIAETAGKRGTCLLGGMDAAQALRNLRLGVGDVRSNEPVKRIKIYVQRHAAGALMDGQASLSGKGTTYSGKGREAMVRVIPI